MEIAGSLNVDKSLSATTIYSGSTDVSELIFSISERGYFTGGNINNIYISGNTTGTTAFFNSFSSDTINSLGLYANNVYTSNGVFSATTSIGTGTTLSVLQSGDTIYSVTNSGTTRIIASNQIPLHNRRMFQLYNPNGNSSWTFGIGQAGGGPGVGMLTFSSSLQNMGGSNVNDVLVLDSGGFVIATNGLQTSQFLSNVLSPNQTSGIGINLSKRGNTGRMIPTSGTVTLFNVGQSLVNSINSSWAPISGNAELNIMRMDMIINQSGTGTVRGIYYNPNITSISGTHYALEATSGLIKISDSLRIGTSDYTEFSPTSNGGLNIGTSNALSSIAINPDGDLNLGTVNTDNVTIGRISIPTIINASNLTVNSTGFLPLVIFGSQTGGSVRSEIRNSASSNTLNSASLQFQVKNNSSAYKEAGVIVANLSSISSGTESSVMDFQTYSSGILATRIRIGGGSISLVGNGIPLSMQDTSGSLRIILQSTNANTMTFGTSWNNINFISLNNNFTSTFNVSSGSTPFNPINIIPTINQTGTATGTIRGIYYNPNITSISGTHYALESTFGNVKIGGNNTKIEVNELHVLDFDNINYKKALSKGTTTNVLWVGQEFGTTDIISNLALNSRIARFAGQANAVNYWELKNSQSNSNVEILASGTDSNIGCTIRPKGSGNVTVVGNTSNSIGTSVFTLNNTVAGGGDSTFIHYNSAASNILNRSVIRLVQANSNAAASCNAYIWSQPVNLTNTLENTKIGFDVMSNGVRSQILNLDATGVTIINKLGIGSLTNPTSQFQVFNSVSSTTVATIKGALNQNVDILKVQNNNDVDVFEIDSLGGTIVNSGLTSNTVSVRGSFSSTGLTTTTNLTLNSTHRNVLVNATSGGVTINLPSAVGNNWIEYRIIKIDSSNNNVTINTLSGQTINGISNKVISTQWNGGLFISDGSNWIFN